MSVHASTKSSNSGLTTHRYRANYVASLQRNTSPSVPPGGSTENEVDAWLTQDTIQRRNDGWQKLDRTLRVCKLHAFAEKLGVDRGLNPRDVKSLKQFFSECLTKGKLTKAKDVEYDAETGVVAEVPGLVLSPVTNVEGHAALHFTIRALPAAAPRVTKKKAAAAAPKRAAAADAAPAAETENVASTPDAETAPTDEIEE